MARGQLRIYLGAAPGVGKTYAMLDEGFRRQARGADVVVGYVETHGRPNTAAQIRDLEVLPRAHFEHRGVTLEEMDLDGLIARRPEVALVDELAHTNATGSRHEKRWEDVAELLDNGIDVISTVNIQHLESLNDVVERITKIRQLETVPDAVVRAAEQVELVDMTPEALRRRLAHGNVYAPEKVDAALSNYFRPGNLAALRELALLWVADRVEEGLRDYLDRHDIDEPWETRERVAVAVTGRPGGDQLIRRAARMAMRARGELLGVHVAPASGLRFEHGDLDDHVSLLRSLGGRYHEVVADEAGPALVAFARDERATQLVLGASNRSRWHRLLHGDVIDIVRRQAGSFDLHVIAPNRPVADVRHVKPARRAPALGYRRRIIGLLVGVVGLPIVTLILASLRGRIELSTVMLAYLSVVLVATAVGGPQPGLATAGAAFLLENYYFVDPIYTFTVAEPENLVSLLGFLIFAAVGSFAVVRLERRSRETARARVEARALARTAGMLVAGTEGLDSLVDNLRTTFGLDAVAVLTRDGAEWREVASAGAPVPKRPEDGETHFVDDHSVMVVVGTTDDADRELMRAFAAHAAAAIEARRLRLEAAEGEAIARTDALRTGLLRAVSHDLRTPLAGIKASVTSLLASDVTFSDSEQKEFLATIDDECDRLTRLVSSLLDASRLQAGVVAVNAIEADVADLVSAALAAVPGTRYMEVDLDDDIPPVRTDPALVERVIANVVANALRYSPPDRPARITAGPVGDRVELLVIDRGPGLPTADREAALQPFQRVADDRAGSGVGLGLAVAHGFAELVGGALRFEDTPGGGLTVAIELPRADR
jgi:two-component system, OmpR family, sensor histidine kinase KdpD